MLKNFFIYIKFLKRADRVILHITFADMRSCEAIWVKALQEPNQIYAVIRPEP